MAYYRNISTAFWTDSKVDDEFTPEDKYFYLYLLTNPHTNITGCYEISIKQMSRETGYNEETILRLLKRFQGEHKVIQYDIKTKEVFLINWNKYNWNSSEKLKKSVLKVAEHIKSQSFKNLIFELANNNISNIDIINNNIQNTEQIQITDTEKKSVTDTDTVSDVCIGYTYPIHTISETEAPKKEKAAQPRTDLNKIIEGYTDNPDLQQALKDFLKMRKALKAPMTDRALQLSINKLDKLGSSEAERIAIINQSIERGWKGLFELKDKHPGSNQDNLVLKSDGYYYDANGEKYI